MVDLLQDGAGDARRVQGEHRQRDEAHVAHRGIGDQLLPVPLHQADQRPVNDGDDRQQGDDGDHLGVLGRLGQQGHREAQETVGAHLQEHRGQDYGAGRGGFRVGVREPGMEGEHRHLHGESDEERPEDPPLQFRTQVQRHQGLDVEGPLAELPDVLEVERQNAQEHEDGAHQRVDDELDGRVDAPLTAPDGDDEVHRHQDQLPEDEEQEEVQGHEDAEHGHLEDQEVGVVFLEPVGDGAPTAQDGNEAEQAGEDHEEQAEAVDAEVIAGADGRDPVGLLDELEVLAAVEGEDQGQANQEPDERSDVGPDLDRPGVRGRDQQQDQEPGKRRPQYDGEYMLHKRGRKLLIVCDSPAAGQYRPPGPVSSGAGSGRSGVRPVISQCPRLSFSGTSSSAPARAAPRHG